MLAIRRSSLECPVSNFESTNEDPQRPSCNFAEHRKTVYQTGGSNPHYAIPLLGGNEKADEPYRIDKDYLVTNQDWNYFDKGK